MTDDLTADDFSDHDLPYRPLQYRSTYRADVRRFALICSGVLALCVALLLLGPF